MARRTLYIVDDEEPIRKSLKLMLTVMGYSVTTFESGPALLNVADSLVPGSLLLDVRMPVMDGIEVQKRLLDGGNDFPVVIMTGHGDLAILITALEQGAIALLEKPFAKSALMEVLDAAFLKLEDPDAYDSRLAAAVASVEGLRDEDRLLLASLAAGHSNDRIASDRAISPAAAEVRRARLFGDLGVEGINGALRLAFAAGLPLLA